jgi:tetratricopeptide (TPR) repeat protein
MSYWHQRKYDDTLVWAQRALDVDPKHLLASEFLAGVYWKTEDIDKFVAENLRVAVTFGVPDEALANLKQVIAKIQDAYAAGGLAGMTRFLADQITSERLDYDHLLKMAFRRAVMYGAANRIDEAFECLDQAISFRDPALVHLAVAPQWDSLRDDPRFGERLKAMRL